ncbi:MAG TPA: serpin family protein [Candidatus Eremiobacteraeota bacterium]|nr:MAG: Serpin (serine protease inhibitor) [bacterium ADurb.Bin363]HPZ08812.1 serpin family protein [Candidatus Eremiobacteraeota bacterium]
MKTKFICLILITGLLFTGYSVANTWKVTSGYTDLGFKLFSELIKENKGQNIFISPSSIAIALSMTHNGAEGNTEKAMAKVLGFESLTLNEVNQGNKLLMETLERNDKKIELSIANSLWLRRDMKFKTDFIKRCKDFYSAEVSNNFSTEAINGWVKKKTNNKIDKIIDRIPDNTILYLINAIYFKGKWQYEFDKKKTVDKDFHLLNGSKKKWPMMSRGGKFNYYKGDNFQAVSLPYGDGSTSMYVFLPDKNKGLEEFQKNLNGKNWESWMKSFQMKEGDIILPRFKIEYETLLNNSLSSLGMAIAFDQSKADFRGMCDISSGNIYISKVIHKTFVEVNEEGTEAAAVTAVAMSLKSVAHQPPERFHMVADHPFFFAIRDNKTGTVLFMGSIVEPK